MIRAAGAALLLAAWTPPLAAQADCFPPPSSNEAKIFAVKSVALAYGPAGTAGALPAGRIRLGVETGYVPSVDDATATPTICRPGKGPENANLLAVLARPRVAVGLGRATVLDLSWVPPVRVAEVKANLVGIAVARSTRVSDGATATLRIHATLGRIRAPFTCPDEALADPTSECYRGTRSDDRYDPNILGADLAFGFGRPGTAWRPYLGAGYNRLEPRFQVHFTNSAGSTDRRKVTVNLNRVVVFGGTTWAVSPAVRLAGEVYAAPADAVTARVLLQVSPGG